MMGRTRVTYIPQMESTECGAAGLAMILAYHGHHAPLPEVRQACGVSRDGSSALDLVQAARRYGLEATGYRLDPEQLEQLPLPAILHWNFDHFVVLERLRRSGAVLVDPAVGRRRVGNADLARHFTGAALVFQPTANLVQRARRRPSLAKYRQVFRRNLPTLAQVLLATLALEVVGLVFPVANQLLLDRVVVPRQLSWLWGLAIGLGLAGVASALFGLVRGWVLLGLHLELNLALTSRFLEHLLNLPLGFFLQRSPGDLIQRAQGNAVLQDLFSSQAVGTLLDGFLLLGFGALMMAYSARLGLLVLAVSLLEAGALALVWGWNRQLAAESLAAEGREGAAMLEAFSGLETTKANGAEARIVQRWAHRMTVRVNRGLERERINLGLGAVLAFGQTLAALLVFYVGGREVMAQRLTLGGFMAFFALQGLFLAPLGVVLGALGQWQFLGIHLGRLDDVLETAPEPSGGSVPTRLRGGIELNRVSFRYSANGEPVLREISLVIRPGEKIALVGPSGAGKTTLARLLLGLHLPDQGTIAFDGQDLAGLDLRALRSQTGVVLQETFLFDDSVHANLTLNDEGIPLERVRRAARIACIDEAVMALPEGYATRAGDNGNRFSGGQRQRLSLARALAHDPAILLLDEATSSLDLATEQQIHANLAALGCTRVIIAHRLATVMDADRILVLEQGRIVQEGPFATLGQVAGPFRTLLESWRGFADG